MTAKHESHKKTLHQKEYNVLRMKTHGSTYFVEKITKGIGSFSSLIAHTIFFTAILLIGQFHILSWDTVLLVLTTGVSLEAIYLAIFIQMSVNQQSEVIRDVEQDVDEIKEDVDEIQKDIDSIEEDVDEIQEDEEEDSKQQRQYQETLATISSDLQKLLEDIEKLKRK